MSKIEILKNRLNNSIRDLSHLMQSRQLTANQKEVLRICRADFRYALRVISNDLTEVQAEQKLQDFVKNLSLRLLVSQELERK